MIKWRRCVRSWKNYLRFEYFARTVKITEKDVKKEYDKNIKLIKSEEKDENEISVKLMFYKMKSEAEAAIKEYKSNPSKFGADFKARSESKDIVVDLQFVKRQEVYELFWDVIKKCSPGTCVARTIQIKGSSYGFNGNNFATVLVGDRRSYHLPIFKEVIQIYSREAELIKAVSICDQLLLNSIISIDDKQYKEKPEEIRHKLLYEIIER